MKKYFLAILAVWFLASPASAAILSLESQKSSMAQEQLFELKVYLNTQNQDINALEGEIIFPNDQLQFQEIRSADSLVTFWVESPALVSDGRIKFSGIVPGGYWSNHGLVFSVVFKSLIFGSGNVSFANTRVLLNDGQGTVAGLSSLPWSFAVTETEPIILNEVKPIVDRDPPEIFTPMITQIADIAGQNYLLVFATQDKGSGIDHYEVREGKGDFNRATSPYVLTNQNLDQKIIVKAVDKNGNERLAELAAVNPQPVWYEKFWFSGIIVGAILTLIVLAVYKKINKNKK